MTQPTAKATAEYFLLHAASKQLGWDAAVAALTEVLITFAAAHNTPNDYIKKEEQKPHGHF